MNGVALEPRITQLRALQVVQVKVGVDEGNFGHRGVPSLWAVTIAARVDRCSVHRQSETGDRHFYWAVGAENYRGIP